MSPETPALATASHASMLCFCAADKDVSNAAENGSTASANGGPGQTCSGVSLPTSPTPSISTQQTRGLISTTQLPVSHTFLPQGTSIPADSYLLAFNINLARSLRSPRCDPPLQNAREYY
eukprot:2541705-Rhodomonas_salina.2